ncbi:MAG: ABC transporter ATP-binding protein [Rhizobiales bacterium]|nr:ABC transporter ATP-binding protein [Hyphomicrobiales bacterium]
MLTVDNLTCGYGDIMAVHGLSFAAGKGEIFAMLGANGAGKTSTIMCLAGHVAATSGRVTLNGTNITDLPAQARVGHGMALVPEGRRVFAELSVEENLVVGGHTIAGPALSANLERIFGHFPRLAERKTQAAGSLSGGEQQMLAIGRALMANPQLVLIDELSLGLMPKAIDACYEVLQALKADGLSILLVEQNTTRVLDIADQVIVLESGVKSWEGTGVEADGNAALLEAYLGTAG